MNINKDFSFDSNDLLSYIYARRKPLLIITIAAIILSSVVSILIKDRYESTAIIFPASSSSISQSLLTESNNKKEVLKFGDKEEVEQLLQVLYSDEIRNRIIDKYDLINHYNIAKDEKYKRTKLVKQFNENIIYTRTEYMSIKIEVLDTDPQIAANIANDIANLVDSVMNRIQQERSTKALHIVEKEFISQKERIKSIEDSLTAIRKLGVVDYESQAEVFNDAYAKAIADGKMKGAEILEQKIKILADYGGAYVALRDLLEFELKKLSVLESKLSEARVDVEQDLPHKFVVSRAEVAEKKSYPIRWLIVLISTISTSLMGLILLIIYDNLKKKT